MNVFIFSIFFFFFLSFPSCFEAVTLKKGFIIVSGAKRTLSDPFAPYHRPPVILYYISPFLHSSPRPFLLRSERMGRHNASVLEAPQVKFSLSDHFPWVKGQQWAFPKHIHNTHTLNHSNPLLLPFLLVCSWKS